MDAVREFFVLGTLAGISALVWVAWEHPQTFTDHFSGFVLGGPVLAVLIGCALLLGYDACNYGWLVDFPLWKQASLMGLLLAVCAVALLLWGLTRVTPKRPTNGVPNKQRKK